jgi:hypothetical protein
MRVRLAHDAIVEKDAMMPSRRLVLGGAAAGALALGGCDYLVARDAGTYRMRLTLAVETPEGPRQASGVIEIAYSMIRSINGGQLQSRETLRGEAVFLDLGQGRHVIMLLAHGPRGDGFDTYLPTQLFLRLGGYDAVDALLKGRTLTGAAELRPPHIPTLVTFSDLADPASARVVYATGYREGPIIPGTSRREMIPAVLVDEIASAFGPGYRLARVTLEMVPAGTRPFNLVGLSGTPVTRGIEGKMAFLTTHREPLRRVSRDMPPRFQTEFGQFIRE